MAKTVMLNTLLDNIFLTSTTVTQKTEAQLKSNHINIQILSQIYHRLRNFTYYINHETARHANHYTAKIIHVFQKEAAHPSILSGQPTPESQTLSTQTDYDSHSLPCFTIA